MTQSLINEHKGVECVVADMSLAEWGRKEIKIAESEMPALMAIRAEYAPKQILKGAVVDHRFFKRRDLVG